MNDSWIGIDFDGVLVKTLDIWQGVGVFGDPIEPMVELAKNLLAQGRQVKIFTARVSEHNTMGADGKIKDSITPIQNWCLKHLGQVLEITNVKDYKMEVLFDDRAITVECNTGKILTKL